MIRFKAISIVAPANTMGPLSAEARDIGRRNLEKLGFTPKYGRHVDDRWLHTAGTVRDRVDDLHAALRDPEVDAVMAVFGGYNSNQLLDRIDWDLVDRHRKPIVGYSDVTALLLAFAARGATAMHGPGFASFCDPNLLDYTARGFARVLAGECVVFEAPAVEADDPWFLKPGLGPRELRPCDGWKIRTEGVAKGPAIVGNLETLVSLAGTPYLPSFEGAVLLIEDATGKSPAVVHRQLTQLRHMGVFGRIAGLGVGGVPAGSALSDTPLLAAILDDVLEGASFPVVCNLHCSHVDPMMTIPLGAVVELGATESPRLVVHAERP